MFIVGGLKNYAQRSRLCAGWGFRVPSACNVSQIYRVKLKIYSFAK